MHIGMIVPGGVDRSGSERVIPALLALIKQLSRRHQVTVVSLAPEPEPSSYTLCGARVLALGLPHGAGHRAQLRSSFLTHFARLHAALRPDPPDVLHAFWLGATSTLALLGGRAFGAGVIVSLGGGELVQLPEIGYGGGGGLRPRLHSALALALAGGVTAGSQYALGPMLARRPDARWVPLGVDSGLNGGQSRVPDVSGLSGLSGEMQYGHSHPYPSNPLNPLNPLSGSPVHPQRHLMHIASLNPVKDQPTLLRALALVAAQLGPDEPLLLDVVGEDTLHGAVQRQAQALGLGPIVRFHGFLPNESVRAMLATAHLHLLSSRHESQSVALLEAALAGVPTVGSAVGLVPELAPAAALATPVGDAAALAAGVVALLRDEPRRQAMGRAAKAWASAHDAAWTAGQFEQLYEQAWYNRKRTALPSQSRLSG